MFKHLVFKISVLIITSLTTDFKSIMLRSCCAIKVLFLAILHRLFCILVTSTPSGSVKVISKAVLLHITSSKLSDILKYWNEENTFLLNQHEQSETQSSRPTVKMENAKTKNQLIWLILNFIHRTIFQYAWCVYSEDLYNFFSNEDNMLFYRSGKVILFVSPISNKWYYNISSLSNKLQDGTTYIDWLYSCSHELIHCLGCHGGQKQSLHGLGVGEEVGKAKNLAIS